MPPAPWRVDDGNHDILLETGRDLRFPFTERGDGDSFEYIIKYKQDKVAFRKLPLMTAMDFPLGKAYFVNQGDPTDDGFGQYEFTRTFASLPNTRTEGETVAWTLSIVTIVGPLSTQDNFAAVATADVVYEYFLNVKPDTIRAQRFYISGYLPERLLIQDSEVSIYKGKIFQRKSYYANVSEISFRPPIPTPP
jgi:hypothetical protein